jgi:hypothetical protein
MSFGLSLKRPRFRSVLAQGAVALLCIGLAACSGTASKTAAPTGSTQVAAPSTGSAPVATAPAAQASIGASGSACGLVTTDEVSAAAGKPMAVSGDAGTICTFSATADPSFVVFLQVYNDQPSMALMKQLEASGSEHLAGMGDDAFWNTTVGTVFVMKGSRAFSIALPSLANLSGSPDAIKANLVTLAKAALARF